MAKTEKGHGNRVTGQHHRFRIRLCPISDFNRAGT